MENINSKFKAYNPAASATSFQLRHETVHLHRVHPPNISFITVLAGAIGNFFRFSVLRNRTNGGPVINYDLLNLNIPMITCGSIIGVVFNNILPEFVISIFLTGILVMSLDKTYKRYVL
jgi:hypothetical protein